MLIVVKEVMSLSFESSYHLVTTDPQLEPGQVIEETIVEEQVYLDGNIDQDIVVEDLEGKITSISFTFFLG